MNDDLESKKTNPESHSPLVHPDKLQKLLSSNYFRIFLTLTLLFFLFFTSFIIAMQTQQKRIQNAQALKEIPESEIELPKERPTTPDGGCTIGGCNSEVCVEESEVDKIVTTCVFKEEYLCYKKAQCARQTDGKCGWKETEELKSCLAQYLSAIL